MAASFRAFLALTMLPAFARAGIPEAAHPDYILAELRMPALYKTMGLAFLGDGTLVLATSDFIGGGEMPEPDVNGKVFLVKGVSTDSLPASLEEVSNTWRQLSGVTVAEGRVYVSDRDGFYEIPDLTSPPDLPANRRLVVKWPNEDHWNYEPYWHQWVFTPVYKDGAFYAPYSGSIHTGGWSNVGPTSHLSGAFLKWDTAGTLEAYAGGLRSPNGANLDPATGEMFVTDNQGSWLPSSAFLRIRKGRFYGHRQSSPDLDSLGNVTEIHEPNFAESLPYDPPVAWLPHGSVRSSPSQPILLKKGTFAGDWLIGDVNGMGLVRVALDKVGEEYNGAVFWFSRGTGIAAINRMAESPDGGIVIGTLTKIGGNWPMGDKCPLYKLTAREQPVAFDFKAVRSLEDGLEIEFTQPVDPDSLRPGRFEVSSAQYLRQKEYGQGKQPDETRPVLDAELSRDRKRVHLKFAALPIDRVVHIKATGLASSGGKALWSDEAWFTLNATAARPWDPEAVSTRSAFRGKVRPAPVFRAWSLTDGSLETGVTCGGSASGCSADGGFEVSLWTPSGKVLAVKSGREDERVRFERPGSGPGVYLIRARGLPAAQGSRYITRLAVF